jgi:hypothetical protein
MRSDPTALLARADAAAEAATQLGIAANELVQAGRELDRHRKGIIMGLAVYAAEAHLRFKGLSSSRVQRVRD